MMNGHAKQKNGHNGAASHAPSKDTPAPSVPAASPPTLSEEIQLLVKKSGDKRYLEGLQRGAFFMAIAVGKLDGESKAKITKQLDMLEDELAASAQAAR